MPHKLALHCVGHSLDDAANARTFSPPRKRNKTHFVGAWSRLLFLRGNGDARERDQVAEFQSISILGHAAGGNAGTDRNCLMTSSKHKKIRTTAENTSPAKVLERELEKLRQDLRATVRAYAARLEINLAESRAALGSLKPAEELSRERLNQLRDLMIHVRKRKLKPEKGRRKDLRKIDSLIEDLKLLVPEKNNRRTA
jgi:hypothetical protein